ncbi:ATP-binding protein [Mariprofundus erugo]|uniref:ATP-dependent nuclease n=1 Tax=Mariprofundus erugo TaxID=2528639 RepID=UPI0010FEE39E|nr:AAA family ATPase [Mariprofundus erugo]TLS74454.1 ATP-binding protein [Mariprofundus erugo]
MITKVFIKNFRSIGSVEIDSLGLTTFVGRNDAGKSNVLRALNLFFKGQTDHGVPFDFERDFNKFAKVGINKAKEIVIELSLELPSGFRKSDRPSEVVWRKVWRSGGIHQKGCFTRYADRTEFSAYSKIPTWLERVTYYYVPAIKDRHYFVDLQGQMYEVLAAVAEKTLRQSASEFEIGIQTHLRELLESVSEMFGSASNMRLPENLRLIFEALEFNSDDIPLSRRGDGIKVRHIPEMLKFMGEKRNSILTMGGVRYTHVWGFEEPENNVELAAAYEMAEGFREVVDDGYQVFVTTHSPAFYSLGIDDKEEEPDSIVYAVRKADNFSEIFEADQEDLDDEIGLMPLVAPFIKREQERLEERSQQNEAALERLRAEVNSTNPVLFVEGPTDKAVFIRVVELFYPSLSGRIKIDDGGRDCYGGAKAAANRAFAWQLLQETRRPEQVVNAVALLDDDSAGADADEDVKLFKEKLGSKSRQIAKIMKLKANSHIGQLRRRGFNVPVDLESLYPDEIWTHAESQNWLEPVSDGRLLERLSAEHKAASIIEGRSPWESLSEEDSRRIKKQWTDPGKLAVASYIREMADEPASGILGGLANAIKPSIKHLFPDERV